MKTGKEVIVIGGGVIGLACAHYLMAAGARVRLIEKDCVGDGASHGNCGLLYFSDVMPLCSPGAVTKELKRAIMGTSPLYIKPEFNLSRLGWLLQFARHCRQDVMDRAARSKYEILTYSQTLFDELLALDGMACDAEKKGILIAFKKSKNFERYQATGDYLSRFAIDSQKIEQPDLADMEPALSNDLAGGWLLTTDWHLRPETLMAVWRQFLCQRGLILEEHSKVLEFDIQGGSLVGVNTVRGRFEADAFVLAAGAWTPGLSEQLGLDLPVEPGKGYSITMARPVNCPSVPCYFYEKNVVATPWESGYRLGGTMEFSGFSDSLNQKRLGKLVTGAGQYLKEPCGDPVVEQWTGLRPMTFDDMPIIDWAPSVENLMIATGHGMLGLTLATGTGKMVADSLLGKTPEVALAPYSVRRFG